MTATRWIEEELSLYLPERRALMKKHIAGLREKGKADDEVAAFMREYVALATMRTYDNDLALDPYTGRVYSAPPEPLDPAVGEILAKYPPPIRWRL